MIGSFRGPGGSFPGFLVLLFSTWTRKRSVMNVRSGIIRIILFFFYIWFRVCEGVMQCFGINSGKGLIVNNIFHSVIEYSIFIVFPTIVELCFSSNYYSLHPTKIVPFRPGTGFKKCNEK